jgi:hypothetical protein
VLLGDGRGGFGAAIDSDAGAFAVSIRCTAYRERREVARRGPAGIPTPEAVRVVGRVLDSEGVSMPLD